MELFPNVLLIPLFAGMIAHWCVAYFRGKIATGLFDYVVTNFGQTLTAVASTLGGLMSAFYAAPEAFHPTILPLQILLYISVFLGGYTGDSVFNGIGSYRKKIPAE